MRPFVTIRVPPDVPVGTLLVGSFGWTPYPEATS